MKKNAKIFDKAPYVFNREVPLMINTGTQNEKELVKALDKTVFKKLNHNLQTMIEEIFGPQKPNTKLKCHLTDNFIKPDIVVE